MKALKYIAVVALGLAACEPEFDKSVEDQRSSFSSGTADFSSFVALGNSLSAGVADNSLYLHGQENSFPNILAGQFALVGGGEFKQPLVKDNLGGMVISPTVTFPNRLVLNAQSQPVPVAGTPTTTVGDALTGPFNNVSVPGAKSFHLLSPGYGNPAGLGSTANPYYVRFASSATSTVLADAMANNPTFFTLWIGNNDILSFATSGGVGTNQAGNTNPATYGPNDISDPNVVAGAIQGMLQQLTANGAKGVVCNIPSVTSIPYFNTVPHNPIPMDQATATATNAAYAQYNGGLLLAQQNNLITAAEVAQRTITFSAGQNAVVIVDEDLTPLGGLNIPSLRMATSEDLIVLGARAVIGTLANPSDPTSVYGVGEPLTDQYVLTKTETAMVTTAQNAYNSAISNIAFAQGVPVVDMKGYLEQLNATGISFNGGMVTATYATGGGFSLDGVHPTAQGYAVIANKVIEVINDKYNANIPTVLPSNYTTIFFE